MRKLVCIVLLLAWLIVLACVAAEKDVTLTGWVSDEYYGAEHTKPGGADCIRKCMKGGAGIGHPEWKPQRMVFVSDQDKKAWVVENPEALKGREGQHVRITGRLDAKGKLVRVRQVVSLEGE